MKNIILAIVLVLFACEKNGEFSPTIHFTHQHIITNISDENSQLFLNGQKLNSESELLAGYRAYKISWEAGKKYKIVSDDYTVAKTAPLKASPFVLKKLNLKYDATQIAEGNFPDIRFALSDDKNYAAVGTYFGELIIYDLKKDKIVYQKDIAEGIVKSLNFVPNSDHIIVGEMSPDGFLYRLDFLNDKLVWRYRIADDLEYSALPEGDNKYGIYTLPSAYHTKIVDNQLLVTGLHSWKKGDSYTRKSKLYSFSFDGQLNWQFPREGTLPTSVSYFDSNTENLIFAISKVSDERIVKENSIHLLSIKSGELLNSIKIEALAPYFKNVAFWESVSISKDNSFSAIGSYDGRAFIFPIVNNTLQKAKVHHLGTPKVQKKIPVMSGISYTTTLKDKSVYVLNESAIPYSYSQANNIYEAPGLHPASGTISFIDSKSNEIHTIKNGYVYSSIHKSKNEESFIAMIDEKKENREAGVYGFSLFNSKYELIYTYNSYHPAFFRGFISQDAAIKMLGVSDLTNKNLFQLHIVL